MGSATLSALSALAGSIIGGITALATSALNHRAQTVAQRRSQERAAREALYQRFIEEASRLFADALERQRPEITALVSLHAVICNIRLRSSEGVVAAAEATSRDILRTYAAPNQDIVAMLQQPENQSTDPLRSFSEACRQELQRL